MKRKAAIILAVVMLLLMTSCQQTLKGTDALLQKAREELPVSSADTIELRYAGLCSKGDSALLWFISGNEYHGQDYLPMECILVGEDEYSFVRTYQPMDFCPDTAVLAWKGGYAFLVNNPDCAALRITDNAGTRDIEIEQDAYPFLLYNKLRPSEYLFLDANGNEIR